MVLVATTSRLSSVAEFLTVLLLFVIVLGATWLTTRYIAGIQKGRQSGTNFEVVETFQLAQNKYAQILRIGEHYVAIAVCKDSITLLQELDEKELVLSNDDAGIKSPVSFDIFLNKAKELTAKNSKKATEQDDTENI